MEKKRGRSLNNQDLESASGGDTIIQGEARYDNDGNFRYSRVTTTTTTEPQQIPLDDIEYPY